MLRATELGRVANAALRSARLPSTIPRFLLSAPVSCRQSSTASLASSLQCLSLDRTQKRLASGWPAARRGKSEYDDANIAKPGGTTPRPWRSTATPDIPNPDSTTPEPAFEDDIVRDTTFNIGDLSNSKSFTDDLTRASAKYPEVRCIPRTGRTVPVTKGADAARAFKVLNMQCASNRVRSDSRMQKFHERAGLKRKRLKSERWQRRFKLAFKATCKRVDELRRQGW